MTEQIQIPAGYTLVERKTLLRFGQSASYLHSGRKRHITRIEECDTGVVVTQHAFRCPHCGKEIFAYDYEEKLPTHEDIEEWCDLQLDMFSNDKKPPLQFQPHLKEKERFFCPRCGVTSPYHESRIPLILEKAEYSISLSRPVGGIEDLFSIPWLKRVDLTGSESLREKITFDLQVGFVHLSLESDNGKIFAYEKPLPRARDEEIGFFGILLKHNRVVKRKLKKAFQSFSTYPIPFSLKELDFKKFLLLTTFTGFPSSFYNAIPWDHGTGWIAEDFQFPANDLHSPENAVKVMHEMGLGRAKSVKRIFAEKPGLFFYLPECKKLWELLGDLNYFCALLRLDHIFYILATFHQYPGAFLFCQDYKKIRGNRSLLLMLKKNFKAISSRAVAYAALSHYARERAMEEIHKGRDCGEIAYVRPQNVIFSYPLGPLPHGGKEITVHRYRFKWLKNTADCRRAAIQLENCLAEWHGMKNPVAVVLNGREYVAAIEIGKDRVIQFLGKRNEEVDQESDLYKAFEKWVRHFSFDTSETNFDDLPF